MPPLFHFKYNNRAMLRVGGLSMNLYEWLKANNNAGFIIESARFKRASDIRSAKPNIESRISGEYVVETTMNSYAVCWEITPRGEDAVVRPSCTCPDLSLIHI